MFVLPQRASRPGERLLDPTPIFQRKPALPYGRTLVDARRRPDVRPFTSNLQYLLSHRNYVLYIRPDSRTQTNIWTEACPVRPKDRKCHCKAAKNRRLGQVTLAQPVFRVPHVHPHLPERCPRCLQAVFLGQVTKRAITDFQKFCRVCPDAIGLIERSPQISLFGLRHDSIEVDSFGRERKGC